jgi:asparagine synthetase B (glutamine-hydrolysing)
MSTLKPLFLKSLKDTIGNENRVAVSISGGKDSMTILFGLLELGVTPIGYCFHVEGVESTDFKVAKKICHDLGVEFVECIIPKQVNIKYIEDLIFKYNRRTKTEVECHYPYFYVFPLVKEKIMLVGLAAGVMMPLTKKACIHYRKDHEALVEYRNYCYHNVTPKAMNELNNMAKTIKVEAPFHTDEILEWFNSKQWDELHKPKEKQVLIDLFPEMFNKHNTMRQMSFQCGDSKIREIFEPLLQDKNLNINNRSRLLDLYRDIYETRKQPRLY